MTSVSCYAHLEALAERGERPVKLVDVRAVVEVEQAAHGILLQAEAAGELGPGDALARASPRRARAWPTTRGGRMATGRPRAGLGRGICAAELDVAAERRDQAVQRVVAGGVRLGRSEGVRLGHVDELDQHAARVRARTDRERHVSSRASRQIASGQAEIASLLGISRQHLYDILRERKPVSPNVAVRLGKLFGDGAEVWVRMQAAYDTWHAAREVDV